jgi:uncharacterized protein (TIGR03437 family)
LKQLFLLTVCACALSAQTLQISPNPLVMTAAVNTGANATLTLTSSGAAINYLVSANAPVSGSQWLHVAQTTQQSTPSTINVSTDPLPAGVYNGSLNVASTAGTFSVPVTLNVSAAGVSPTALNFSYVLGTSIPPPQSVTVSLPANTTASVVRSTTSGGNWLDIGVAGGSTPTGVTATIDPVVAPTLPAGTYSGTITVTPTSGSNLTPATVQVTLAVSTSPTVTVTPASLSFNYQLGGTNNLTMQTIQLAAGAQAIPSFSITPNVSWLSVNPSVGTIPANGVQTITVTVLQPSATPGTYNGILTLQTAVTQQIPVTVNVSSNPLLNVPATPLSFTYQIGGGVPAAQSVIPTSTGAALQYTAAASQPWLIVPTGTLTTPNPVSISVNPLNLVPGTYSGSVTFTNTAAGSVGQQVLVTLQVTNNPVLGLSPNLLTFVYQVGQQQPAAQIVSVFSTTEVPLSYTATTSTPWLALVGHTSGTTDDSFTVSVNTTGVPVGNNSGTINVAVANAATGASLGNVTLPVTLYVSNSPLLVVNPATPIYFLVNPGTQTSAPQNISLSGTSTDVLTLSIGQPQTDSGGQWLFVSSVNSATPSTLSLIASLPAGGLAPGLYTGSVTVTATIGGVPVADSPYKIPVGLIVATGSISASVPSLSFTQSASGAPPPAQTFNVTSNPAGLNFFVTPYDGGLGWLSATAATGAAPGSVRVSVDGSRLSPGTYQGRVIVISNSAASSPLVVPVTLQVNSGTLSAPTTPLVFTAPAGSTTALTRSVAVSGSPGPLTFSVVASTTSGNWLTVTPGSANTPATVQVTANPSGLGINTYTGSITITSPGATGSPITIPVTLNIVAPQTLTVTPAALQFVYTIGQTGALASQTVQVQSSGGAVAFTAAASSSGNWLQVSPASGTTSASLTVSVNPQGLAAGTYSGAVTVTSQNSLAATPVQVTLTVSTIPKPVITGVTNGASGASNAISPGETIVIYGTGLGPAAVVSGVLAADGRVATTLSDTQVSFAGGQTFAPMIYAWNQQTSGMVPYGIAGLNSVTVQVIYKGVASDPFTINVTAVTPGVFTQNQTATGPGLIFNSDGHTVNTPNTPAARGSVIAVYMTGGGLTSPPSVDGFITPTTPGSVLPKPLLAVTARVGALPATVTYAGAAPGFVAGFMQVNVMIPPNGPSGIIPLVISLGATAISDGTPSQSGVTVAVQ